MAKSDKYSIKDFSNDAVCLQYLFDTLHTRQCSCGGEYNPLFHWDDREKELVGRKQLQCSQCRFQIAPMANILSQN